MSDKVVSIRSRQPHLSGPARCLKCKHEWVAVAEVGTVTLTCPSCDLDFGVYQAAPVPDLAWQCNCGCQLFYLMPDGHMCAHCGSMQCYG
jgi:hypothetical protein